jgi:excisionase family DNA binding protein
MPKIINFANYPSPKDTPVRRVSPEVPMYIPQKIDISDDEYKLTVNILVHNNPNKINFTIDEVAAQLSVSREFIRTRTKSGKIKVIQYGDKPMIHISELARILTKGIE